MTIQATKASICAADAHRRASTAFRAGITLPISWRKNQLQALRSMISENEKAIQKAVFADLGKSPEEVWLAETQASINGIDSMIANVDSWSRATHVNTDVFNYPATSMIKPEPLGTALIIGCWNYPITLIADPMAASIAAGNAVVVKTGAETHSPKTMQLLCELIPKYMDKEVISIVSGGFDELQDLLSMRWDVIFATGSPGLGRMVAKAGAPNLTKCILELGGKSPVYVGKDANLAVAAKRIVWGSLGLNAGQTCVRPDHMFVDSSIAEAFISTLKETIVAQYGVDPQQSTAFGRMAKVPAHHERLANMIKNDSKYIVHGGETDASDFYVAPTLLDFGADSDAYHAAACMQEEIFGPILPILRVDSAEEAIDSILTREKPLAMYAFTHDRHVQDMFMNVSAGSLQFNDTITFMLNENLPFGGVGNSGSGKYHGYQGFVEFSHMKSIMINSNLNDLKARFSPQTNIDMAVMKLAHRHIPAIVVSSLNQMHYFAFATVAVGAAAFMLGKYI
ncbi:hypothetical protein SARC_01125 [Sphaeroforma arctica JP610]|uniref:Aldehyde dehydrogenase n=1 Tax=Sphaeroforma arctica JP610 TaxID=667725 RepID=A0A0L0GCX8_9EUKA|nr:hypothetical protein SARC_01125 [Sphaeroforma arctica JP610]KNC86746.1 hypothetical protein SARC_01125 [Sphaeroforma arctica JP610]|eukprot:XP_014160648.1 hypothetical protein SARC_01125 [Sphaeroforma arctica JP610]